MPKQPASIKSEREQNSPETQLSLPIMRVTIMELCKESESIRHKFTEDVIHCFGEISFMAVSMAFFNRDKYLPVIFEVLKEELFISPIGENNISDENAFKLAVIFCAVFLSMSVYALSAIGAIVNRKLINASFNEKLQKYQSKIMTTTDYTELKKILTDVSEINTDERDLLAKSRLITAGMLVFAFVEQVLDIVTHYLRNNILKAGIEFVLSSIMIVPMYISFSFWRFTKNKSKQDVVIHKAVQDMIRGLPNVICKFIIPGSIWSSYLKISFGLTIDLNEVVEFDLEDRIIQMRYKDIYKTLLNFIERTNIFTIRQLDDHNLIIDSVIKRSFVASDKKYFSDLSILKNRLRINKEYYLPKLNFIFQSDSRKWRALEIETLAGDSKLKFIYDLQGLSTEMQNDYKAIVNELFKSFIIEATIAHQELSLLMSINVALPVEKFKKMIIDTAQKKVEAHFYAPKSSAQTADKHAESPNKSVNEQQENSAYNPGKAEKRRKEPKDNQYNTSNSASKTAALPYIRPKEKLLGRLLWPNHVYFNENPDCELIPLRHRGSDDNLPTYFFCYVDKLLTQQFSTKDLGDKMIGILFKGIITDGGKGKQGYTRWEKTYKNCHGTKCVSFFKAKDPSEDGRVMVRIDDHQSRKEVLVCADSWLAHTH